MILWCDLGQLLSVFEGRARVSAIAAEIDERQEGVTIVWVPRQTLLEFRHCLADTAG